MMVAHDPETLRLYASIFAKPYRDYKGGVLHLPVPAQLAAVDALRFLADELERSQRAMVDACAIPREMLK